jgi:hypothetical protein
MRKKRVKGLSSSERKRERNEIEVKYIEKVKGKRNERCSKAESE